MVYNGFMNTEDFEFEDKSYVSPTISRDEQLGFLENLRQTKDANISRINADTHNLGTDIASNLGGLTGSEAAFESRYVTPKTDAIVDSLKTAAQATALNQALTNLQNQYKERYNKAYRGAKIREYNKSLTSSQGTGGTGGTGQGLQLTTNPGGDGTEEIIDPANKDYTPQGYGMDVYKDPATGERLVLNTPSDWSEMVIKGNPFQYNKTAEGDRVTIGNENLIFVNGAWRAIGGTL